MASLTSSRAFTSARASAPSRRSVRVCCQKQGGASVQRAALAAAAAAMLTAFPVNAKVILEQPQLRKVLQDDGTPAAPAPKKEIRLPGTKAAAPAKAAPAAKAEESSVGGEFDPKSAALPLALVSLAGGAVALTKLDDGFADFMDTAGAKNSNDLGAGYEVALKEGGVAALAKKTPAPSKRASPTGTKRVKAANKSLGGLGGLGNLFGSKDE